MVEKKIFRQYDIRGVVPDQFNPEILKIIGNTFGQNLKKKLNKVPVVSVGRDVRLSSNDLFKGLTAGLTDAGCDVINLGTTPTPVTYFSSFKLHTDAFMMITGSHNPPEYNGLKFGIGKDTVHSEGITDLYNDIINGQYLITDKRGNIKDYDIISDYIQFYEENFTELKQKIRTIKGVKVVIDAGNGAASLVAPKIFELLGVDVVKLYCEPDGRFPNHHPDPTVEENLDDAKEVVKIDKADFAVAFDGDADRIGVLDESGNIIWGDILLYIYARELKERYEKPKIIADVKSSKLLFDMLDNIGAEGIMWKTGHSLIKQKLKETGAELAGEMSGHIFFKDRFFGFDDAIYAAVRFLEAYVENKLEGKIEKCSDLTKDLPKVYNTPEIRFECDDNKKFKIVEQLSEIFNEYLKNGKLGIKSIISIDGVRVNFDNGWGLIRASNTQPVLVMRFEAENIEAMNNYKKIFEAELSKIKI
ncbi:phosphomannomutase/phosphoglucomutase [Calditerrivibrio nitroreducens]|uniref:Phosphoglucomutase/phosphomannomutase alpha/beta/alpha domain II n=1 Tax=Calditerrivibrio nitroreducens (strain DSM 19672 / NBRC 101217 / Yu37-1) TaxID=768670 RepID=E4TJU3_CALNY|nr:phosphomannomutase/phosphoglucomutase [Calditerrivibrio nitroreducens]ADR19289.1 phosphoglucomutase/phosphomannomutase alpha/beta/alpha domain II [Calditerrivibrio nitroreducens DSM 19672]